MRPLETTVTLASFEGRGPGTDAERRAARWLAQTLRADGHRARIETFWCRPNWALAHAWHVALALAGSLLSVSHPVPGAVLLAAALLSTLADGLTGVSPGRRLTPERASQNVILEAPPDEANAKATLVLTANYDAGRTALAYRDPFRRPAAALRRILGPCALGWLGSLSLAIAWLLAIAVIRITTHNPPDSLGAIQLPPSLALVLGLALLLEAAGARYGPAAGDNASGAGVAIALARTLKSAPPRNLTVDLVLQGAGEGQEIGLRTYLRGRPRDEIVLGIAACGAGKPRWWVSDGRLIPIPYTRRLRDLARETAREHAHAHRGRGGTPAFPARMKGLPSITIGNLDSRGLAERSHQKADDAQAVDAAAVARAFELGFVLIEAIDAAVGAERAPGESAATPA